MARRLASGAGTTLRVNAARLWHTLEGYARYGATPGGGVDRPIFSPADVQVRQALLRAILALDATPAGALPV